MTDLHGFVRTAETSPPDQIFRALQALVQAEVGAVIFSCSTFDLQAAKSRRIYTNLPDIYPVSGLKDIIPNLWTRQVLDAKKPFVANTLDELKQVFPDHAIIESLGCGSAINMPVFLSGRFLGTVNVLNKPQYYQPEVVEKLRGLQAASMLAFCSYMMG